MKLLVAERSDPLAGRLRDVFAAHGEPCVLLDEGELLTAPMACERNGTAVGGYVRLGSDDVPLGELSGVLLRPRRDWWPSTRLDVQDQMFVYHETVASWFALLSDLECPVANRFELGWWLHDLAYPEELRCVLADELGVETTPAGTPVYDSGRLLPAPLDTSRSVALYLAGERVIARCDEGRALAGRLRPEALERWRRAHGVVFCRLDFAAGRPHRLEHVELLPPLEGESPAVVDRLATAMEEVLA